MFAEIWTYLKSDFSPRLIERTTELVVAPKENPDMLWFVIPLITVTLLMTFYFGKYKKEELGWNTAVGNTLVLVFVSMDLLRHIYNSSSPGFSNFFLDPPRSIIALIVAIEGIFLLFANFLHFLPKKAAFFISSALPVNLTAYTVMSIVYTDVKVDWLTLWSALFLFLILFLFLNMLKLLEGLFVKRMDYVREEEEEEEKEEKKLEKLESKMKKTRLKKR